MNKAKINPFLCMIAMMFVAQNAYSAFAYLQDEPSAEEQKHIEMDISTLNTSLLKGPVSNTAPMSLAFNPLLASENIDSHFIDQQAIEPQEALSEVADSVYSTTQVMHEMGVFSFKGVSSVDDGYDEIYSF
ncbi:hypothetical protein [Vibrio navarrensis]|uniref:hypothetical protein n=1 Tax=Vibrio navarrensis TaxID=29495 RepID=UPI001302DA39|nr:hypothetical protein [Vibrio navarrensis]